MGKRNKPNLKLSEILPRAAGPVNFASPPPSPVRTNSTKARVSLVPREIRRKNPTLSFDKREPTSPKVSCVGRVGNRNKKQQQKKKESEIMVCCKRFIRIFRGKKQTKETQGVDYDKSPGDVVQLQKSETEIKSLGQMKRFSSGRGGALHNFNAQQHEL